MLPPQLGDKRVHIGPDAWVELVYSALAELGPTQHLIGTQLVELDSLELNSACHVTAGKARLESYVQAWHELPDDKVWLFLGTYHDDVVFRPGTGWRIDRMHLRQTSAEIRARGDAERNLESLTAE